MGEDRKQPENWQNGAIDPDRKSIVAGQMPQQSFLARQQP
jgi:hypothetical protein